MTPERDFGIIDDMFHGSSIPRRTLFAAIALFSAWCAHAAYDIGEDIASGAFWSSDPVLFVKRHEANGFQFTADARESADSRLDGGVEFLGIPVFETRVFFGEAGGVERVEAMLFTSAGVEAWEDLGSMRRRVRLDRTIDRNGFARLLDDVRAKLTPPGGKAPEPVAERTSSSAARRKSQTWQKSTLSLPVTLTWDYSQQGARAETFAPGFVRLAVAKAAPAVKTAVKRAPVAKGAARIADNVVRNPRGDVYVENVPMVDQGQKGYCAVAAAERVLRYYGLAVDEHEIAAGAGTSADSGTSLLGMRDTVQAIGKKFRLAVVTAYGDFDKGSAERINGLVGEVSAYNKTARKMKKPEIPESAYIRRAGSTIYYDPGAVDELKDPEVRREMRVNGPLKSKYTKFMADVRQQIDKGIPLFWGVDMGIYPEPNAPQGRGGHMRLIIGYNDKRKEILYSDTWGAGHELKRMPADWAWTISRALMYLKPLR